MDVFISYAHEDQRFVRKMVAALEAEGLSIWWDHTIPPGKTWDTHIARGLLEARACIVVWSQHSVSSDWVREEAALAKRTGKLLPIRIDPAEPPVGFSLIQAAQLDGWTGDRSDPQWQMLTAALRSLQQEDPVVVAVPPRVARRAFKAPVRTVIWAVAAILAIGAAGISTIVFWVNGPSDSANDSQQALSDAPITTEAATGLRATQPEADTAIREELERLRRQNRDLVSGAQAAATKADMGPPEWPHVWRGIRRIRCDAIGNAPAFDRTETLYYELYENGTLREPQETNAVEGTWVRLGDTMTFEEGFGNFASGPIEGSIVSGSGDRCGFPGRAGCTCSFTLERR